ncbi:hypothetical protein Trydic_g123 [Trypoxylus dichotomus]
MELADSRAEITMNEVGEGVSSQSQSREPAEIGPFESGMIRMPEETRPPPFGSSSLGPYARGKFRREGSVEPGTITREPIVEACFFRS